MNNVDRRIVEMQFDNKDFEKHVQTSVDTLDKLKKSLNLEQSAKGFYELDRAAKSVNLSALAEAAEAITSKFSFIGTVSDQVFRRIADAAINVGAKIKGFVEELTIKPVATGFDEYETQINAIQTIMSNTRDELTKRGLDDGERLALVNEKLDELNHYADKTIYNFTEMTHNIGTFTAAGVELDTAVASIQGIANLAAISGSTSEQASRGMYQLSQAISTGTVRLQDWNSVVNAGMGGEVFQKALLRTADAMGVTVDATVTETTKGGKKIKKTIQRTASDCVEAAGSFRDSLSQGWLTDEVLTKTLEQLSWDFEQEAKDMGYTAENMEEGIAKAMEKHKLDLIGQGYTKEAAEEIVQLAKDASEAATKVKTFTQLFDTLKEAAQSGWTQTWQYIIGDFEQAKELLTSISDHFGKIIDASAQARNQIMAGWANLGGRDELIQSFWNVVAAIENIVGVIRKEFKTFFPPTTGRQLFNLTKQIREFTDRVKAITENSEVMAKFGRVAAGAAAALDTLKTAAVWALGILRQLFGITEPMAGGILDMVASVGDFLVEIRKTLRVSDTVQKALSTLGAGAKMVRDLFTKAISAIGKTVTNVVTKIKASGIFGKIGKAIGAFTAKIPDAVRAIEFWGKAIADSIQKSETLQKAWGGIKGFFSNLIRNVKNVAGRIQAVVSSFMGADTSGKAGLWEKIKARFAAGFSSLSDWFGEARETLLQKWSDLRDFIYNLFTNTLPRYLTGLKAKAITNWPWLEQVFGFFEKAWARIEAFCAPLIKQIGERGQAIRDAVQKLFDGDGNGEEVRFGQTLMNAATKAWETIRSFFGKLVDKTIPEWFEKVKAINWGGLIKTAFGVFTGIKLLSAITAIGRLGKGLASLGDGLKGIGGMMKGIAKDGLTVTKVVQNKDSFSTSLLKVAAAIGVMVAAVVVLANMETGKASRGIYMLGVIGLELLTVTALFKMVSADGDALLKAAAAVALLIVPIHLLGKMDTDSAWKGILRVGAIIAELALMMKFAGTGLQGKQAFISMALSVNLLVLAVKSLGRMELGPIAQGIIGLGVVMAELVGFTRFTKPTQIKGLLTMALAVNLLVLAVKSLGRMKLGELAQGVAGLGVILVAFTKVIQASAQTSIGGSLTTLALMVGSMIAFSFALKNVDGVPWQTIAAFSAGMAGIAIAMALVVKTLSNVSPIGAAKAAAALVIIGAGIGAAVAALAGLVGAAVTGFSENMVRVGANLKAYSNAVSGLNTEKIKASITLLKDLAAAAAEITITDTSGFEDFASQISLLGARLSLFGRFTAEIDTDATAKAKTMIEDIGTMAEAMAGMQANELDPNLLGAALTNFGSGIELYAIACKDAKGLTSETESGIDAQRISDLFGELGKVQIDEGTIRTIAGYAAGGGNDLTSFALGLTAIGNALQAYKDSIQGIGLVDAAKAGITLGMINQLQSNLPREDNSVIAWIAGKKQTLSLFADNVTLLGGALNSFAGSLTNDTASLSERGVGAIKALSDIQNELTKQGGVKQWFTGTEDLGALGTGLITLGTGFNEFVNSMNGFKGKEKLVGKAAEVIESLAGIQSKLTSTNGMAQWFTGAQNIGTFGSNLNTFATKFKEFCETLTGVTIPGNMESISGIVEKFAELAVKLDAVEPYDLSSYIKWIGEGLNTFFGNGRGGIGGVTVDPAKLTAITGFVESLAGVVTQLDGIRAENYGFMQSLLDALAALKLPEVVGGALEQVYAAIQNGQNQFTKAVSQLISAGERTARSTYGAWLRVGQYLASGICNGITAMAGSIRRAAVSVASGAIRSIAVTWRVHSPSRVGAELGMNFDLGIAGGIGDYSKVVSDQSKGVAQSAVNAAKTMLNGTGGSLFDGLDPNPTIRPVLDLSNVQSGVSAIGNMLEGDPRLSQSLFQGVNVNRNAGALGFDGTKILGSQSNRDVVNELRNLTDRFNRLSDAVTNMQLVLDTGTLVGQTSAKMDRQLGVQASRRERGN